MLNAASLVNFGQAGLVVGDWTYSAAPLSAPSYLPMSSDTATYLTSSYPTLGATYADKAVGYSFTSQTVPPLRSPANAGYTWNALFGNKTYFLWHPSGNMMASTDLVNWTQRGIPVQYMAYSTAASSTIANYYSPAAPSANWKSMCYGNGKLVAIRQINVVNSVFTYGNTAMSSDGGVTWTFGGLPGLTLSGATSYPVYWSSVTFADGTFTAYGTMYLNSNTQSYGIISQSNDGVNWTTATGSVMTTPSLTDSTFIMYGNGTYMWSTGIAATMYYTSTNFTTTSSATVGSLLNRDCAYGAGLFVAIQAGTSFYTSPTGATWTARTVPNQTWTSITYANGYFVAVGTTGSASTTIITSPDGITWTSQNVPSSTARGTVAGGLGKFFYQNDVPVSVSGSGTLTQINFSALSSTFTLPMISNPPLGTQAYMKAT